MEMTQRLITALNDLEAMRAPSVAKILRNERFSYEALRVERLVDAWLEAKFLPEPVKHVVHLMHTEDADTVTAQPGVKVTTINYDVVEEQCPGCFEEFALERGEGEEPEDMYPHICKFCGFDTDWTTDMIMKWIISREETNGNVS